MMMTTTMMVKTRAQLFKTSVVTSLRDVKFLNLLYLQEKAPFFWCKTVKRFCNVKAPLNFFSEKYYFCEHYMA